MYEQWKLYRTWSVQWGVFKRSLPIEKASTNYKVGIHSPSAIFIAERLSRRFYLFLSLISGVSLNNTCL